MTPILLDDVKRLVVGPGEALAVTLTHHPTFDDLEQIRKVFETHLPGVPVIVLAGDEIALTVVAQVSA
jgi:hypothetical protein